MAVTQTIIYEGDLRCRAVHDQSQTTLITDAPLDNQGKGESFSPTDLTATALATCLLTTMAIAARKNGVDLGRCEARIEKHMTPSPPRRIARLACHITARGIEDPKMRKKLEEAAQACPVHLSLHPGIEQAISIAWE